MSAQGLFTLPAASALRSQKVEKLGCFYKILRFAQLPSGVPASIPQSIAFFQSVWYNVTSIGMFQ